jgi:hypothetical protein
MIEQPPQPGDDLAVSKQQAEVDKLHLEIAALKREPSRYKSIVEATPFIAAMLTLASLWAGAYKYFEDRKEARMAQETAQVRTDVDQILSFPTDTKISLARVAFLLHDLGELTTQNSAARKDVTDVIEATVMNDLDFDKLRDAGFGSTVLDHWTDYTMRLRESGGTEQIRYKYFQALRHLYEANNSYFSTIDYDPSKKGYAVKAFTEENQYLLFRTLVDGYRKHVEFIRNDGERKDAISKFGQALHNPSLATKMFENSP